MNASNALRDGLSEYIAWLERKRWESLTQAQLDEADAKIARAKAALAASSPAPGGREAGHAPNCQLKSWAHSSEVECDCRPSRESQMVVVRRDQSGTPTVWCDPEIVDLVRALNDAGLRTVASCSGHGERPGNIALADGRELFIAPAFDEARRIEVAIGPRDAGAASLSARGAPGAQKPLDGQANNAGVATGSRNCPPRESVTLGSLAPTQCTDRSVAP